MNSRNFREIAGFGGSHSDVIPKSGFNPAKTRAISGLVFEKSGDSLKSMLFSD
jgi:hypothetical protein